MTASSSSPLFGAEAHNRRTYEFMKTPAVINFGIHVDHELSLVDLGVNVGF